MNETLAGGSVLAFYEGLAEEYHLLFADWHESIRWQASVLEPLLRRLGAPPPRTLLDCSCGVGTQALALAGKGYTVHGTDLSPASVGRAAEEAQRLGLPLTTGVADLRALEADVAGAFDVVLSCDNALPHLLTDGDLEAAARSMHGKLVPGGLLVVSLRDYAALTAQRPRFDSQRVFDGPEGQRIVFQVWEWAPDLKSYVVRQFILRSREGDWRVTHRETRYRALLREELEAVLARVGFAEVRWHLPAESGYYQPIVTARRPAG